MVDEAGNIFEVDAAGNVMAHVGKVGGGGNPVVAPNPMRVEQQQAEFERQSRADKRAEDAAARAEREFQYRMQKDAEDAARKSRTASGKPLRQGDADKLDEQVTNFNYLQDSLNSFQPEYAGNTITGEAENWFQGKIGTGTPGQRDWWSNFRTADNLIRNSLFGASLTEGEKSAYGQTTVTPDMSPEEVRRNIDRRVEIAQGVLERKVNRLRAAGYNRDEIDATIGEFGSLMQGDEIPIDAAEFGPDGVMTNPSQGDPTRKNPGVQYDGLDYGRRMTALQREGADARAAAQPTTELRAGPVERYVTDEDKRTTAIMQAAFDRGASFGELETLEKQFTGRGFDDPEKWRQYVQYRDANPGARIPRINPAESGQRSGFENGVASAMDAQVPIKLPGLAPTTFSPGAVGAGLFNATTLGFGDNIVGAFDESAAERMNYGSDYLAEQNPISSIAGNVAGSLAPTQLLAKGAGKAAGLFGNRGAKLLGKPGQQMTAGNIAYGTGYGAGSDEESRLRGAGIGALAALGGDFAGQQIGRIASTSPAATKLGNIARNAIGGRQKPTITKPSATDKLVINAAGDDYGSILSNLSDAQKFGLPMTLADANTPLQSLAGATVRRSPQAKAMAEGVFQPRAQGQYDRLVGAVERDLGPVANIPEYSDQLIKKARLASRPLYDEAFAAPGASSVKLDGILKTPMGAKGMQNAVSRIRNTLGPDGMPSDPRSLGFDFNDAGEVAINKTPSFETIDQLKQGLDDVIEAGFDPISRQYTPDARAAISLKDELLKQADSVNPAYAQARAAYAGPAGERQSLQMGRDALASSPDAMAFQMKPLSGGKADQYKLGYRSGMVENAGKVRYSTNPWENAYGSPQSRAKVGMISPEGAESFGRQYGLERSMADSNRSILGNSMTAERQLADGAFGSNVLGDVALDALTTGAPIKTGATILGRLTKDELGRIGAKKRADALAPILFNANPKIVAENLEKILKETKRNKRARGIFGNRGKGLSSVTSPLSLSFLPSGNE
jgi:hypothetical protein